MLRVVLQNSAFFNSDEAMNQRARTIGVIFFLAAIAPVVFDRDVEVQAAKKPHKTKQHAKAPAQQGKNGQQANAATRKKAAKAPEKAAAKNDKNLAVAGAAAGTVGGFAGQHGIGPVVSSAAHAGIHGQQLAALIHQLKRK